MKGSMIQLVNGKLKKVEDLNSEDFKGCSDESPNLRLSNCKIQSICQSKNPGFNSLTTFLTDQKTQVTFDVLEEYPFFVHNKGWSSCCPEKTEQIYKLPCQKITVGDTCITLALKDPPSSFTLPTTCLYTPTTSERPTTASSIQHPPCSSKANQMPLQENTDEYGSHKAFLNTNVSQLAVPLSRRRRQSAPQLYCT
ncbi:ataxin-1-like [Protopterus annectens]|uniref:ataxin-1-like n=1 Tax=Protopterus annectens TaxID=7888 RepID=UPI001CFAB3DD|nr:ataxin-1-like [Protopterus annectens]